ncbi:hypothetical protein LWI28_020137 [Acer negundo]|uniref:Uncharacterized protein n=1 Tax=Acer negundo TaxID=4023 RepID=A0AAD5JDN0_ACENE|nr:hypothetical protein LWI28_020137 [Acer negundo]
MPPQPHFLLVVFPAQGHINPALQLAKGLLRMGTRVTYATSVSTQRRKTPTSSPPDGLTFAAFSDGYDDGLNSPDDDNVQQYLSVLKRRGSETLNHLIAGSEKGDVITKSGNDPSCLINLPGLPPLTSRDLPSFLIPSNNYSFALPSFQEQLKTLDLETKPRILVNTCDALEPEALRAIDKFNMVAIGPSIPSAFLDGEDPNDTCFGGDIFHGHNSKNYKEWLNSKSE